MTLFTINKYHVQANTQIEHPMQLAYWLSQFCAEEHCRLVAVYGQWFIFEPTKPQPTEMDFQHFLAEHGYIQVASAAQIKALREAYFADRTA